jgi:hypothetical protein
MITSAAEKKGLRPRLDIVEAGWQFWELRTLNRHRAVGYMKNAGVISDAQNLESAIRDVFSRDFHRSWWRGFAYGVVAQLHTHTWQVGDLQPMVNLYENAKGVLQWIAVVDEISCSVFGVHTWLEVYLSPVYLEILGQLETRGYSISTAVRQKDGLWKFLTGMSGLKGVMFPEFRKGQ